VEKTSREVKEAACIALKPDQLSSEEEANVMLLNYAAKEAASWLAFGCRIALRGNASAGAAVRSGQVSPTASSADVFDVAPRQTIPLADDGGRI